MREIKFRAWDKKNKKMLDVWQIHFVKKNIAHTYTEVNEVLVEQDTTIHGDDLTFGLDKLGKFYVEPQIILLQYTGLKDKNGKEIYEGDIVKFYSNSQLGVWSGQILQERKCYVVWDDENLKWSITDGKNEIPNLCKTIDDNQFEVIGNIYENPELLLEKT